VALWLSLPCFVCTFPGPLDSHWLVVFCSPRPPPLPRPPPATHPPATRHPPPTPQRQPTHHSPPTTRHPPPATHHPPTNANPPTTHRPPANANPPTPCCPQTRCGAPTVRAAVNKVLWALSSCCLAHTATVHAAGNVVPALVATILTFSQALQTSGLAGAGGSDGSPTPPVTTTTATTTASTIGPSGPSPGTSPPGSAQGVLVALDLLMDMCTHCDDALALVLESGVAVDVVRLMRELGTRGCGPTHLATIARGCALVTVLAGRAGVPTSPSALGSVGALGMLCALHPALHPTLRRSPCRDPRLLWRSFCVEWEGALDTPAHSCRNNAPHLCPSLPSRLFQSAPPPPLSWDGVGIFFSPAHTYTPVLLLPSPPPSHHHHPQPLAPLNPWHPLSCPPSSSFFQYRAWCPPGQARAWRRAWCVPGASRPRPRPVTTTPWPSRCWRRRWACSVC
jgi:hypothetical protein